MHYRYAVLFQPSIAALVALRSIAHSVAYSVNLNPEACFRAIKVEHVGSDWMLAAEDRLAGQSRTQSFP